MNTVQLTTGGFDISALVSQVIAESKPTVIETPAGESAVIMPLQEFTAWQETAYLLSNSANAAHLRKSIAEASSGHAALHQLDERQLEEQ